MIQTIKGDILKLAAAGEFDMILQGCNCFNAMSGGLAKQISQKYPEAVEIDNTTAEGDIFKLGDYTMAQVDNDVGGQFWIVNLYTQYLPGANFEYAALRSALSLFLGELEPDVVNIGIPQIGAGIGGGDWKVITQIIEDAFMDLDWALPTYVEFDPS